MADFPTDWITANEGAQISGYSPVTLRWLVREGRIKGLKRAGVWFLDRSSVLAYVEEMKRLGPSKHDPWRTGARTNDT